MVGDDEDIGFEAGVSGEEAGLGEFFYVGAEEYAFAGVFYEEDGGGVVIGE